MANQNDEIPDLCSIYRARSQRVDTPDQVGPSEPRRYEALQPVQSCEEIRRSVDRTNCSMVFGALTLSNGLDLDGPELGAGSDDLVSAAKLRGRGGDPFGEGCGS